MESNALSSAHIVEALATMNAAGATPTSIKSANDFLRDCEAHPHFPISLLNIFSEVESSQLQMCCLLLLTNVIKRNWNSKRSSTNPMRAEVKEQLRSKILEAYFLHDLQHFKHFNALLGYLTRLDYPSQYGSLHQFLANSLQQVGEMASSDLSSVVSSKRVLVVLSTCKAVVKEYNSKKISHNEEAFLHYIAPLIQMADPLSDLLYEKAKASLLHSGEDDTITINLF